MGRPQVPSGFTCYHCGSLRTARAGLTKNNKKNFYCHDCRRRFRENPLLRSRKSKRPVKADLPSKEYLLAELNDVARELGRAPTTNDWPGLRELERVYP